MKRLLSLLLILAVGIGLCACRADMTDANPTTQPTEEQLKAIQIIAPFDIYQADSQAAGNVQLSVQEGYKLIQDINSDDYPYKRYHDPYSSGWGWIDIVPMLLEADMQNRTMLYTAKTNYSGFYEGVSNYVGSEATDDVSIRWRLKDTLLSGSTSSERPEHIWVDILIQADGNIVGFAVLEIVDWIYNGNKLTDAYTIEDRYTEYYPLIDGQFQEIDEAFVWQRVEQYHQYAE